MKCVCQHHNNIIIIINRGSTINYQFSDYAVVIWSDVLGGVHMWSSALFWSSCTDSTERTHIWTQTTQTQQYCLF